MIKEKKYSLSIKIISKIPLVGNKIRCFYNMKRHQNISQQLEPLFNNALQKVNNSDEKKKDLRVIWFFWWQGKEYMPPITKACYKSLLKNAGDRKIILISKTNVKKYACIPDYIFNKVNSGKITLTHFSDILRFNLLKNYGGLWMDATLYTTGSVNIVPTNNLFTCSGYPDKLKSNVANGRWTGFLIGGPAGLRIFNFMDQFFKDYWGKNDELIDYFLIDYALNYAYNENLSDFQQVSQKWLNFQPNLFDLEDILSKKYNQKKWLELTETTSIFKLSNKFKINKKRKNTFYKKL